MSDLNYVFCNYGFLRDMIPHNVDFNSIETFAFVPTQRYEDKEVKVTQDELNKRFGFNADVNAYEYDSKFYYEEVQKLNIPKFNRSFQQPQRILSFFNNIRNSLKMLVDSPNKYDDETIIFLFRSDIGVKNYDVNLASKLLETSDVVVEKRSSNGVRDMFFIFKLKNVEIFLSLYESYKKYVVNFNKKIEPKPNNDVPESILTYHIENYCGKKITPNAEVFKFNFKHICSPYCGHNKQNTKILGEI